MVEKLHQRGVAKVIVHSSKDYDLCNIGAIRQLLLDAAYPGNNGQRTAVDMVIYPAARCGGIGANQAHPAAFFYDNLMMGVQLLHESWRAGVGKFVSIGTICAYPKFTPVPSA